MNPPGNPTRMDARGRDAYLEQVLIGGPEHREIVIADYDPGWPARFKRERQRLQRALGRPAPVVP